MILFFYSHPELASATTPVLILAFTALVVLIFVQQLERNKSTAWAYGALAGLVLLSASGIIWLARPVPANQLVMYSKSFPADSLRERVLVSCLLNSPNDSALIYRDVIDCGDSLEQTREQLSRQRQQMKLASIYQKQRAALAAASSSGKH